MTRKSVIIIFMTAILICIIACSDNQKERYNASFLELFDTVTQIVGYSKSKEEFTKYSQMIYDELKVYHELYDIYNNYEGINNIKTINDNAGIAPVKVDKRIIELLLFSKEVYELTDGKTNVAFGAVLSVWHQYRTDGVDDPENAELPPMEVLRENAKYTNIQDIIIDEDQSTVFLKHPKMRLDVGAVAKGYATERVSRYVMEHGFNNGMISVGGNVRTLGSKLDDRNNLIPWSVGIQNPDLESEDSNLYVLKLTDYSLVTSGVYERYYTVKGKQYHHIIDPNTLMPSEYFLSVSIVCKDGGLADAISTAVFCMPYETGLKLIETQDDIEALWVMKDGSIHYSSGFEKLIK